MNIPNDLFEEITACTTVLDTDAPIPSDRRSQRVRLSTQVPLIAWDHAGQADSVRLRDVSIGGLGILHNRQVSLDDRFVVQLPRSDQRHLLLLCTVVYWEPLAEGLFGIGARFDRIIADTELVERQNILADEQARESTGVLARITGALTRRLRKAV